MGVMKCNRKGCDNIMCQTYIDNIGYICNECKSEFLKLQDKKLNKRFLKFINTQKI